MTCPSARKIRQLSGKGKGGRLELPDSSPFSRTEGCPLPHLYNYGGRNEILQALVSHR
jgi:hypothetical protein